MNNYPNDLVNIITSALRDKYDQGAGLSLTNANDVQQTVYEYPITIDTRDCIGTQSLEDAQTVAEFNGTRPAAFGTVVFATNTSPIIATLDDVTNLRDGDNIIINGIRGNTGANGFFTLSSVTITTSPRGTVELDPSTGNGTYAGGGTWERPMDPGYPMRTQNNSYIKDNVLVYVLEKPLKDIRTLSLYDIIIPRDIIPLSTYIGDFITVSTSYTTNVVYPGLTSTDFTTFVPQEQNYLNQRMIGFYTSPLDLWRSYRNGSLSMPDQVTPPPMELWNPPVGDWPLQPIPYPFQTVPTYRSKTFTVTGSSSTFHLILSGYGCYDLLDWTANTGNPTIDAVTTSLMRKLLLFLIVQKQSYNDVDYIDLIINCNTVTPGNNVFPFGFGDFQRIVPGPGYQQNYQPCTNTTFPADPTIVGPDNPIAFPNFRGNVCGPYNYPGAPFQKLGICTLIQDLYLNGDLNNLFGNSVVLPDVPTEAIPDHSSFGLNFLSLIEVNLGNINTTTNLNILNAMRIMPNGFGAAVIRANGQGNAYYTSVYGLTSGLGAGGQGPSDLGVPNAWVNHGIYNATGTLNDPIAQGPLATNVTAQSADASYPGVGLAEITNNTSFTDSGTNFGSFVTNILKYIEFAVNDNPDTDLIVKIDEVERTKAQSTNSYNSDSILDAPIRLNTGTTNGTQQYIESVVSRVSSASFYWEHRYLPPHAKLDKMHLRFTTYDGQAIPLEKMLQQRKSLELQKLTLKILNDLNYQSNPFNITYLFNPLNPKLIGRVKRYFQIIFKANCYETVSPGLNVTSYQGIPPYMNASESVRPYG
jgi:hypothetical protein